MIQLNIPNLDKLIAHLEAQPPERINMAFVPLNNSGCGCIKAHAREMLQGMSLQSFLGFSEEQTRALMMPLGFEQEQFRVTRYPAHRVIATLKRLRDRFLATGEIVVDWGLEPGEGRPWSAPQAVEQIAVLPTSLTRLLSDPVEVA